MFLVGSRGDAKLANRIHTYKLKEVLGASSSGGRWSEIPHNQYQGVGVRPNDMKSIDESDNELPEAACVLIISDDGKILAVSRKDDPTDFGMPGGSVDKGESPKEAAARELYEETGLHAYGLRKVFEASDGSHYVTTFIGEVEGTINTNESGTIRWVEPGVLLKCSFAKYNRQLFKALNILRSV